MLHFFVLGMLKYESLVGQLTRSTAMLTMLKKKLPKWYCRVSLINLCTMNLCNSVSIYGVLRVDTKATLALCCCWKMFQHQLGINLFPNPTESQGSGEFSQSEDERAAAPPPSRLFFGWNSFSFIAPEARNRMTLKNCLWDHLEIQGHYTLIESINKRSENFVCSGRWLRPVLYVNVAPHVRNIEMILMSTTRSVVPLAMFGK